MDRLQRNPVELIEQIADEDRVSGRAHPDSTRTQGGLESAFGSTHLGTAATRPHEELKSALAARRRRWTPRRTLSSIAIVALLGGAIWYRSTQRQPKGPHYETTPVTRDDVVLRVRANGTVQAELQVNVGAQVSGRVVDVYVDFNSLVKKGDVLAEIDPTLSATDVAQHKANLIAQRGQLESAKSTAESTRLTLERTKRMFQGSATTQTALESAQTAYDVARAAVVSAEGTLAATRARLDLAKTNLTNTKILSPIDGVVVARNVDPGAGVVANFQVETLFIIAKDLRHMRIVAHVDEADVGELAASMEVVATVDAYRGQKFFGAIRQIRYSGEVVQGVVTYPTVIDLSNPDGKLRPGMTATVTVNAKHATNALRVKNAALRFQPSQTTTQGKGTDNEPDHGSDRGTLWRLRRDENGSETIEPVPVKLGITDGTYTELVDPPLSPETPIATDEVGP